MTMTFFMTYDKKCHSEHPNLFSLWEGLGMRLVCGHFLEQHQIRIVCGQSVICQHRKWNELWPTQ